jgi:phosphopantetheinyl transferase (holo-ACP synthase)
MFSDRSDRYFFYLLELLKKREQKRTVVEHKKIEKRYSKYKKITVTLSHRSPVGIEVGNGTRKTRSASAFC